MKQFSNSLDFLNFYFSRFKKKLGVIFATVLFYTILQVISPILLGTAIGLIGENAIANDLTNTKFVYLVGIIFITFLLTCLTGFYYSFEFANVVSKISHSMRVQLLKQIQKLTISRLDSTKNGALLSRFTNDLDNIQSGLSDTVLSLLSNSILLLGFLAAMFIFNVKMALITVCLTPLLLVITFLLAYKGKYYTEKQQFEMAELNSMLDEAISTHKVTILNNQYENVLKKFNQNNKRFSVVSYKAQLYSGMIQPIATAIYMMNTCLIIFYGANIALLDTYNIGVSIALIVTYVQFCHDFYQPLIDIATSYAKIQTTQTSIHRIFQIYQEPCETENEKKEELAEIQEIEFRNVSFSYGEKEVLHNISFKLRKGEKLAIVGTTGSGKTTIINLLQRFYESFEGEILVNHKSICDYSIDELRGRMGLVLQDTLLFSETISENIKFSLPSASQEDIERVAKMVGVHEYINSLKSQYETQISAVNDPFSNGQKQLLSLARTLLASFELILLDEATSSVDTLTEEKLLDTIAVATAGKTVVVIAHRLKTVMNANHILVLKEGKIIETGAHSDLLEKKGYYYETYRHQFVFD